MSQDKIAVTENKISFPHFLQSLRELTLRTSALTRFIFNQTVHQPAQANRRNGVLGPVLQAGLGRESTLDEKGEMKG
jgi:hypothetical protein